jgi:ABC-type transport system involved in cytochrome bd biosynthesis fused ATPase/permease subunit
MLLGSGRKAALKVSGLSFLSSLVMKLLLTISIILSLSTHPLAV